MVHRHQWDSSWGAKKFNFLIRDIDGPAMTAAPVESCQAVVLRSLRGRLGSIKYMCNRLRRLRRRFQINIHLSALYLYWPWFAKDFDPELSGEPQALPHAV